MMRKVIPHFDGEPIPEARSDIMIDVLVRFSKNDIFRVSQLNEYGASIELETGDLEVELEVSKQEVEKMIEALRLINHNLKYI